MSETRLMLHPIETDPKLLALLEQAKARPPMTADEIAAQRKSWVIGELMLEDETLTREAAEKRYDAATGTAPRADDVRLEAVGLMRALADWLLIQDPLKHYDACKALTDVASRLFASTSSPQQPGQGK